MKQAVFFLLLALVVQAGAWPSDTRKMNPTSTPYVYDSSKEEFQSWKWFFDQLGARNFKMPSEGQTFAFTDYFDAVNEQEVKEGDLVAILNPKHEVVIGLVLEDCNHDPIPVKFPTPFGFIAMPVKGNDIIGILRPKYHIGEVAK